MGIIVCILNSETNLCNIEYKKKTIAFEKKQGDVHLLKTGR
jgi:hypothetical protein